MGENLAQKLLDSARQEKKNDSQKESVGLNIMGCIFIFKDLDLPWKQPDISGITKA